MCICVPQPQSDIQNQIFGIITTEAKGENANALCLKGNEIDRKRVHRTHRTKSNDTYVL